MTTENCRVAVLMGSISDWDVMSHCSKTLDTLGIEHDVQVMSAHRTPDVVEDYVHNAPGRGIEIIIAAAGGAAHLAGVVAGGTTLPVLGVPMKAWSLEGLDSLLSTVQMPAGIPVGTLAIGKAGAINAAMLAGQILALNDDAIANAVEAFRQSQREKVLAAGDPRQAMSSGSTAR